MPKLPGCPRARHATPVYRVSMCFWPKPKQKQKQKLSEPEPHSQQRSRAEQPPPWSVPLQALIKRRLLASHFPLGFWRWRGRCTGAGGVLVLGCRWLHSAEHPLRHMTPSNRCVCVPVCVCPVCVLRCMLPSDWAVSWPALGALRRCFAALLLLACCMQHAAARRFALSSLMASLLKLYWGRRSAPRSLSLSVSVALVLPFYECHFYNPLLMTN